MSQASTESLLEDLSWLRALARRLATDPHLADDIVQDACAIALQQTTPPRRRRAWLKTVLQNLLHAHRHRERSRRRREANDPGRTGEATEALVQRAEAQQRLAAAVLQLDEPYRTTVLLRFFDGLPPRRIAALHQVPVATVHSRLQRALQQLRQQLDRDLGGREVWLVAFAPFTTGTLVDSATGITLMQAKLKLLAAAAAIACTTPLWWPTSGDVATDVLARAPAASRDGGANGSGSGSPGSARPARNERRSATPAAPVPAAPAPRFVIRGRVSDCSGAGVPEVLVAEKGAHAGAAPSDATGNFELETGGNAASLVAADDSFVTVLDGDWTRESTIPPVVVVARAITVAGSVVESNGAPVPGCHLLLQLPQDFDSRFPMPLDRAGYGRWQTSGDAAGAFAWPRLPAIEGASLLITADAFAPQSVPLPSNDDEHVQVVLQRFRFEAGELMGTVTDAAGAPVGGARVAMGVTSVVTDGDGHFGLSLRRAGWPTAIVAAKAGYLPARLELPRNGGKSRESWPAPIVLRLGPAPRSVRGRVLDRDQKGIAGAEVWISDPTPLGVVGVLPVQLEYLIAGGEVPPRAAAMQVPFADDPTQEGNVMTQVGMAPAPTACWFYATANDEGVFELPGLLDRSYRLRALDPGSGLFGEVGEVTGGSYVEIPIDRASVWPELRGRVLSLQGQPVPGVRIEQSIVAHEAKARIPGGDFRGAALRQGQATTSGPDGSFVFRDVGSRGCRFELSGDAIVPTHVLGETIADPKNCLVTVEARCHIEVALQDPDEADEVRCLDANGVPIDLAVLRHNSMQFTTEIALHNGRSGLFVVGERAAKLRLLRAGELVREVAITPTPGRTTTVQ